MDQKCLHIGNFIWLNLVGSGPLPFMRELNQQYSRITYEDVQYISQKGFPVVHCHRELVEGNYSFSRFTAVSAVTFHIWHVKAMQVVVGLDKVAYLLMFTNILL